MNKITFKDYIAERKTKKGFMAILFIYLSACLASAVYWLSAGNTRNLIMSFAFMVFVPLLLFFEHILLLRCGEIFTATILFLSFGSIMGTCFNIYTIIPSFDNILHTLSGVLGGCLGFAIAEILFGKAQTKKAFAGCILFAAFFSLTVAVAWEVFEYFCTCFLGFDMMEDSIVTRIESYLLMGNHDAAAILDNITKTIIHYGDGQIYTLEGYLDLGLEDTLNDMIVCLLGTLGFIVVSVISYFKYPKINEMLTPQLKSQIKEESCVN